MFDLLPFFLPHYSEALSSPCILVLMFDLTRPDSQFLCTCVYYYYFIVFTHRSTVLSILISAPKYALHAPSKIFANVVKWTVIAILTSSPIYSIIQSVLPGAYNDVRVEGKGRSVQRPHKRLKFENVLVVVPLLFLACSDKHVNGDSTKNEKEKSQYQATMHL